MIPSEKDQITKPRKRIDPRLLTAAFGMVIVPFASVLILFFGLPEKTVAGAVYIVGVIVPVTLFLLLRRRDEGTAEPTEKEPTYEKRHAEDQSGENRNKGNDSDEDDAGEGDVDPYEFADDMLKAADELIAKKAEAKAPEVGALEKSIVVGPPLKLRAKNSDDQD